MTIQERCFSTFMTCGWQRYWTIESPADSLSRFWKALSAWDLAWPSNLWNFPSLLLRSSSKIRMDVTATAESTTWPEMEAVAGTDRINHQMTNESRQPRKEAAALMAFYFMALMWIKMKFLRRANSAIRYHFRSSKTPKKIYYHHLYIVYKLHYNFIIMMIIIITLARLIKSRENENISSSSAN